MRNDTASANRGAERTPSTAKLTNVETRPGDSAGNGASCSAGEWRRLSFCIDALYGLALDVAFVVGAVVTVTVLLPFALLHLLLTSPREV